MTTPSGGTAPNDASSELTQAIEIFLASGFTPRQLLQLAGLCASVCDETGYGDVHAVFTNRRPATLKKTHSYEMAK